MEDGELLMWTLNCERHEAFDGLKASVREEMKDEDELEEASVPLTCEIYVEGERQKSCRSVVDAGEGVEAGGPRKMKLVIA